MRSLIFLGLGFIIHTAASQLPGGGIGSGPTYQVVIERNTRAGLADIQIHHAGGITTIAAGSAFNRPLVNPRRMVVINRDDACYIDPVMGTVCDFDDITRTFSRGCQSHTINVYRPGTPLHYQINISLTPSLSISNLDYACALDDVPLRPRMLATEGFNSYTWQYQFDGKGWRSHPTTTNSVSLDEDEFGTLPDFEWNTPVRMRYRVLGCDWVANSRPFEFRRAPPKITTTPTPQAPQCAGDNGTITFRAADLSRDPITDETFTFMVYQGTSAPMFLGSINESTSLGDLQGLATTVPGGSQTYNDSLVTFNLPPNSGSNKYYLFIFPSISNNSTILSSGCGMADFHDFKVPNADTLKVDISSIPPVCNNEDATISLSISNGVPPYEIIMYSGLGTDEQYTASSNNSSVDLKVPIGVVDADFFVEVKDKNECDFRTADAISKLDNPPSFSVSAGIEPSADVQCDGGTATVTTGASLPGTYTYRLHRSSDDVVIDSENADETGADLTAPEGSYYVTALNASGCPSSNEAPVSTADPTAVVAQVINSTPPKCLGEDGSFIVSASGGSGSGYEFSVDGGPFQASGTFNARTPGRYEVTARDGVGCPSSILSVTVLDDATPLGFTATPAPQKCSYQENGEIVVTNVTHALGVLRYSLDDVVYQSLATFSNLATGLYTVYVNDGTCTASLSNINVGSPSPLAASFDMTPVPCFGQSNGKLRVNPSGGTGPYRYLWSNGSTTREITAGAGTYTVTVTDANDCELLNQTSEITEPEELFADFMKTDITCHLANDGVIELTDESGGNGSNTYTWSDGATTRNRSGLSAAVYNVTIEDSKGCSFTISGMEIINPEPLELTISQQVNVNCKNETTGSLTMNLTGGTGAYEYQLNGGAFQTSNTFSNLPAGDYIVVAIDDENCTDEVRTRITEPLEVLSLTFEDNINATCDTNGVIRAVVSGGTPPYRYSWVDNIRNETLPATGEQITVPAGQYVLTVLDDKDCEVGGTRNLTSDDGAMVTILNQTQPTCSYLANGSATISLSGVPPFTTTWDHGETGASPTRLSVGDNWFSVVDGNDCLIRERVSFEEPTPLVVEMVSQTLPTCRGDRDGTLAIAVAGGNGNYRIRWDHGPTDATLTGLPAGDYTVRIEDDKQCELVETFTLPDKELLEVTLLPLDPSCEGTLDGRIEAVATGGNGAYNFSWSNDLSTPLIDGLAAGSYRVVVTDALGCTATAEVTLDDPAPTLFTMEDLAICSGQSYQLSAPVEALNYRWVGPGGFEETGEEVVVSVPGTYDLLIEDLVGCPSQAQFEVVIDDDALMADFLVATTSFVGDTLILIDISWPIPDSVRWELPEAARVISRTPDFAELVFDVPGTYNLTMFSELGGCNASYQQVITIEERSEIDVQGFVFAAPPESAIKKLAVYPNPAIDRFTVELSLREAGQATVQLVDVGGNTIPYNETLKGRKDYAIRLDTRSMLPGIYFLQAKVGEEQKTIRVMVK
ncbi:MAG: T9SS type A sorting domain-containing protein [Bacteroidota bacterium]